MLPNKLKTLKYQFTGTTPDIGAKPYMQTMDIDIPKDKDIMVLDALQLAKEADPTIFLEDLVERAFAVRME